MMSLKEQIRWCTRGQWVLAGSSLLVLGGFYLLLYKPTTAKLAQLNSAMITRQRELADNSTRARDLPAVATQVSLMKARLDRSRRLPQPNQFPQFIRDMTALSQQSSLRKFQYKPDVPQRNELFCLL